MKRVVITPVLLLLVVIAPIAFAGPVTRMLVPVYIETPVPGAHGSLWVSDLTMFNPGPAEQWVKWCSPTEERPCILNFFDDEYLQPGETQRGLPGRYLKPEGGNPGAVVYVETRGVPGPPVAAQLRVKDESRNAQSAGTEVPVVREESFRTEQTQLLGIVADERFRTLLRIYDMNLDAADFRVRILDEVTGNTLSERTSRALTSRGAQEGPYRFQPAYAQLPEVTAGIANGTRVRIEVTPLTPGSTFWVFASVTNNVSQEFTVVTPQ